MSYITGQYAIPKEWYDRAASWMADNEDTCLLEETMPKEDVEQYLLDEAFDIMGWIYETYNKERGYL